MPKNSFGFEKREQHSSSFSSSALKRKVDFDEGNSRGEMAQKSRYDGLSQKSKCLPRTTIRKDAQSRFPDSASEGHYFYQSCSVLLRSSNNF